MTEAIYAGGFEKTWAEDQRKMKHERSQEVSLGRQQAQSEYV